ncbi:MAG: sugar ABC transporter permease [Anaerolineaceae bacterium]|nr:sugar ABC transporter permease [Anaerolineaceae bacterium]
MKTTKISKMARREEIEGYLFILPWVLGVCVFLITPIILSVFFSLTDYDYVSKPEFVGLQNYVQALTKDPLVWQTLKITFIYSAMAVPLELMLSFGMAILLNFRGSGIKVFRAIFYLPSILPPVAVSILWLWIFNPKFGIFNQVLGWVGIDGPAWLFDPEWALPALVIMSLWGFGRGMIIYLAGLQNINSEYYDAVKVDGANAFRSFFAITLPLMSPVIFFNLIMGIIGSLQAFAQAYIMTGGGPARSTQFFMLYIYQNAFSFFKAGYASALGWILFIIIFIFSLLIIRSSSAWVFYEGELRGRN